VAADKDGRIWYTANRTGAIGKLDPKTGAVTEYQMPDPAAKDPHTPACDQRGVLWFTVQNGNFVGKLVPSTGAITLKPALTMKAMPHGLIVDASGTPFFAMAGANKIGRVNPDTLELTEYVLPEGARPRRLAATRDGRIWYGDSGRGFLGRLDPKSGEVKEFSSPGGPKSGPYAIAVTGDAAIWYVETEVQPNVLVRFDPRTEQMQSWPLLSSGGVVRHMVAAPGGALWLACSGIGKIARAETGR
jgi:virginiamycin B lyase